MSFLPKTWHLIKLVSVCQKHYLPNLVESPDCFLFVSRLTTLFLLPIETENGTQVPGLS